jgi:quercetin dioxygenase-like cupin family protein
MNPQIKKTFENPDETRPIKKGKVEILNMAPGLPVMRTTFEPGWKWSECVKPVAGTESCQVPHLVYVVSGRIVVRMDDEQEIEYGPGDVGLVPPGHDAWVVGNEPYVGIDYQGGALYAKPA